VSGAPSATVERALGVDVGSVRVGVAASDPSGTIASPVTVLQRARRREVWSRLRAEIANRGVTVLVVGLPRRLDGSEGDAAQDARSFAGEATLELGLPTVMWDERLTTVQAERSLIAAGTRRRKRKDTIDSVAASLMLQSWLDARRPR
jgi:putative Holliday junction resolvase